MVSYEVSMGFVMVSVLLCVGSLNLTDIVRAQQNVWFCIPLFPMFIVFFISALAETNRSPFDLPEGESEIVAGFFVEYSAMSFALFFLGEYANMILMSAMTTILFLGGWLAPFGIAPFTWIPGPIWFILKICFCLFVFLWVRATFPRYRYDQLMRLGWKVFLPLSLLWLVITAGVLMAFGWLPNASSVASVSCGSASDGIGRPCSRRSRHAAKEPEMAFLDRTARSLLLGELVAGLCADAALLLQAARRRSTTRTRRARSARASKASTRCAAIRTARNAASPASCARRSARRRPSPSRPNRATTAPAAPRATTST